MSNAPLPTESAETKRLKLSEVRRIYRLIGEVRELAADPQQWRQHMIRRLATLFDAAVVVSSEIHARTTAKPGTLKITDIGWGCDQGDHLWQIQSEREEENPSEFWLSIVNTEKPQAVPGQENVTVPVEPTKPVHGGKSFIMSQYALPHVGTVDQLGLHREWGDKPFGPTDHRLARIFHLELGRLWKRDAINRAKNPSKDLAPRLAQTLEALLNGASEKEVSNQLGISRHTVHNYVKALHQRFGVNSRGELLAKARKPAEFVPKFSVDSKKS